MVSCVVHHLIGIPCFLYCRCLRIICDNFQQFLEFQSNNVKEEPPPKKRKSSSKGTSVLARQSSSSSHDKNSERDCTYGHNNQKITGQPFEEAKSCLFSLKDSLESLYKKNLFPYNPTALLKRFVLSVLFIFRFIFL